jgi:hypothetical protein
MKRKILYLALLMFSQAYVYSQDAPKKPLSERIFFGGNLGAQFGTFTVVEVSPLVGYRITERLAAGIGGTYIYLSVKDLDYETNIFGGKIFSEYAIIESLVAHVEYEVLNFEAIDDFTDEIKRVNVGSLLIGGGYRQRIGENSFITLMLLYNLTETRYTPYENPIIRIGFAFGL